MNHKKSRIKSIITAGFCLSFASCLLFTNCGQTTDTSDSKLTPPASTDGANTPALTGTEDQTLTLTPTISTIPSQTAVSTPEITPAPEPTEAPTPTPVWLVEKWYDYSKNDSALSENPCMDSGDPLTAADDLIYEPGIYPQLFARYHGKLEKYVYIIDVLEYPDSCQFLRLCFYDISIGGFSSPTLVQKLILPIYYMDLDTVDDFFEIIDLNNDGYGDFRLDFGYGLKNHYDAYFVYDTKSEQYSYLGTFSNAIFSAEDQILYQIFYGTREQTASKFRIEETQAILAESLTEHPEGRHLYTYTYRKRIDDKVITLLDHVSYDELCEIADISLWPSIRRTPD